MERDRLLVVDADLPPRLATELGNRGRAATSAANIGLKTAVDPDLLRAIADRYSTKGTAWVLVTGDDAMPAEHADVIRETHATIATIHPSTPTSSPSTPGASTSSTAGRTRCRSKIRRRCAATRWLARRSGGHAAAT